MKAMGEDKTEGRCLCGDVCVTVRGLGHEISGCYCDLCARWGGGVQFGIATPAEGVSVTGPLKRHRSSRIAERAWCDTCGTAVWLRDVAGPNTDVIELCPGLFENAGGARLVRMNYTDRAAGGIEIAGDHERVTQAEYDARHPNLNEEA